MARVIKQYRFYENNSSKNQPSSSANDYISGQVFGENLPILQLGIQALPGTRFYLNGSDVDPIIIGSTGIFELDLNSTIEISQIQFDQASIKTINDNKNAYLIVDTIYNDRS